MFRWLLARGKDTKILCSGCTIKEYDSLNIRVRWSMSDIGKAYSCDNCHECKVIARSDLG